MAAPVRIFVSAVCAAGLAGLALAALAVARADADEFDLTLLVFAGAFLVAEFFPVQTPDQEGSASFSTTFGFAMLLAAGTSTTVLVVTALVILADLVRRLAALKAAFNAAQYALSFGAAGVTLTALGSPTGGDGLGTLAVEHLPALAAATLVFLAVNTALASTPPALSRGASPLDEMRGDLGYQAWSTAVLVALTPIVLVVADYDLWLVPLLGLPIVAIQRGGRQAVLNAHRARHDMLTGLPNRVHLHERVRAEIRASAAHKRMVGVLVLDLDGFKDVNETLGHQYGDLMLREVAERLRGAAKPDELVARMGGDEFAVVLGQMTDPAESVRAAQRIADALEMPMSLQGVDLDVRASIGIANHPRDGEEADMLLRHADMAMRAAEERRTGFALYDESLDQHGPERLALVAELRRGIDAGELRLHYQPKLDMLSRESPAVEALVRWQHPQRGLLYPGAFIDLAEHTGLVRPMTSWVLREALEQQARWAATGLDLAVAVNVSVRALTPELPEELAALLEEHPGARLEIEITESTMMGNAEEGLRLLHALAGLGVRLAVDDFGTGFSSLAYLKQLPVHEIKIDRTFVCGMDRDQGDRAIVRSTIELARHLALDVVAEGIESIEVVDELRKLGCRFGQGFAISRPLPPDDLAEWMGRPFGPPAPSRSSRGVPSGRGS